MDIKKNGVYQGILEEQKKKLLEKIASHNKPEDFGSDVDGLDEESDEAEEQGNSLAIAQSLKENVSEIDSALEKIKTGKYGMCSTCNNPVEEEVLDIAPESALCRACKKTF
ncbi:MAG: hypothetical protein NUV53_04570 [Patescibacteria group bacterium]|nr:hypothetical protein [Patescibacteria group bacterium]